MTAQTVETVPPVEMEPIAKSLAGRRIVVTGATGFLGTALVERLLRCVADCELMLLVRPGRSTSATTRVHREVMRNDAFDRLRTELGREAYEAMFAARVSVLAGDVSSDGLGLDDEDRQRLATADIMIHSAATVSFDSPLDQAVEVNLLGPGRIVATLADLGVRPHLIAVSTCYVAGNHRGAAPEAPVSDSPYFVDVDWRLEVDASRRMRSDADAASRAPGMLTRFRRAARRELGAAGGPLLAAKTEQLRESWVSDQMVEAGRARAASLGWPDAYAYTKAHGEVALADQRGNLPVTIVRPSIIESALAEPRPGWIRGFRMAEPVLISYAKGLLREFPGVPEGVVDVIPVDLVVAAIIDAAARGPVGDGITIVQVASGSANPLRYDHLVDLVSNWFSEHPLYDKNDHPIAVSAWSFPGRGRVQGQLRRANAALTRAERLVQSLPLRGRQAEWSARLEEQREQSERALGFVTLYGAYTECEAVYGVDELLARWETRSDGDRAAFGFDPRAIDWAHYVCDVHLPSIVDHARVRTVPGARNIDRSARLRRQILSPDRHLAAFDLENTLIASNVVASYAWLASRRLGRRDRAELAVRLLAEAPSLLLRDRKDRSDFLRHFYRRYEDAPIAELDDDAREMFSDLILAKSFPAGIRRVRQHRELGHRTVLITGALDVVVAPLGPLFDDIVCARLNRSGDTLTGELREVPATGEARAQAMADYAAAEGLDLDESVAYADSTSDLPMLEAVGFPVAVNPETRLAALARKRGWLVEDFGRQKGMHSRLLPLAPMVRNPA